MLYREQEWCPSRGTRGCGCRARWAGIAVLALVISMLLYHHTVRRPLGFA